MLSLFRMDELTELLTLASPVQRRLVYLIRPPLNISRCGLHSSTYFTQNRVNAIGAKVGAPNLMVCMARAG